MPVPRVDEVVNAWPRESDPSAFTTAQNVEQLLAVNGTTDTLASLESAGCSPAIAGPAPSAVAAAKDNKILAKPVRCIAISFSPNRRERRVSAFSNEVKI
jgi:hypothetical protein